MTWWHYLLLANVYLIVFFGFYWLFLRKETFFQLNRVYLVGGAILSFLIPLIQSDWIKTLFITQQVQATIYNINPLKVYQITARADDQLTLGQIIGMIYLIGIIILSIKFIWQLISLNRIIKQPEPAAAAYSFFNTIKVEKDMDDSEIITAHEKAHARQWHSADILLIEAIMIFNWFNPVVYFYRKTIKHIHEFIADQDALKAGTDKAEYAMLLLSQTFITPAHSLVNPFFSHSLLKQRIMMLHKDKSARIKLIKYGLSAPLFALMLILSSATVNNSNTITIIHDKAEEVFLTPAVTENTSEIITPTAIDADKPLTAIEAGVAKKVICETDEPVFTVTEKMPSFPGGIEAFYKYLAKTLHYPAVAREKNVQGRVFVSFTVEKNGHLSDIKVMRGIGSGCDEEAVRAIAHSPNWIAGMQNHKKVRTRFTVPISFTLNEKAALSPVHKQQDTETVTATVFTSGAHPAEFPGGIEKFYRFLAANVRYPAQARENNLQGNVFIQFTVETNGSITNAKVLHDIGGGAGQEALRVFTLSPKWMPCEQNGQKVKSVYTVPVSFVLENAKKSQLKDTVLKKVQMIMIKRRDVNRFTDDSELSLGDLDTTKKITRIFINHKDQGDFNPLYILDGKEMDSKSLAKLNPENIQSINVLNGTPATSRYGIKAAGGVVLVTTKSLN